MLTRGGLGHLQCLLYNVSPHPPGAIHQHHLLKHTPHLGNKMAVRGRREEGRKRRREEERGEELGGGKNKKAVIPTATDTTRRHISIAENTTSPKLSLPLFSFSLSLLPSLLLLRSLPPSLPPSTPSTPYVCTVAALKSLSQ